MEEIIHSFGIDGRLIVIQIFNFALLLAALWYFLYTPVLRVIEERQRKIAQGVRDADDAKKKLSASESEGALIVQTANTEADAIVARAKEAAKRESANLVAEGHARSERLQSEVRAKAEAEAETLKRESEKEIAKAAILAAERVLKERA